MPKVAVSAAMVTVRRCFSTNLFIACLICQDALIDVRHREFDLRLVAAPRFAVQGADGHALVVEANLDVELSGFAVAQEGEHVTSRGGREVLKT